MKVCIDDRVSLNKGALLLSYVKGRHWYTNVYEGKTGTIIGFTDNKLAIQFDEPIFVKPSTGDYRKSSHNNGCHGKGKINYCWYFPISCLTINTDDKFYMNMYVLAYIN